MSQQASACDAGQSPPDSFVQSIMGIAVLHSTCKAENTTVLQTVLGLP